MKISATIITFNEAGKIRAACESVAWADELVVVDSESTDDTREIAAECGARVITHPWPGFAEQKQFAAEAATHDWIFSLDADERLSYELRNSIEELRSADESTLADGYSIARRAYYMGRWIRGGGWYPDRQLRLYRKSRGHWLGPHIHESVKMDENARVEILAGDLLHYTTDNPIEHRRMIEERYAPLGAQKMFGQGKRASSLKVATIGPATFIRSYVLKGGFRDGRAGFEIARMAAYHARLKYQILQRLQEDK
ncbi:MAG TPA: glycosyltransferase family 2 protein [Pyrinomonadaceae bacterium]|nr:glycosyltransferase family 2 protein [Pyrinomonadaceae bacterium]